MVVAKPLGPWIIGPMNATICQAIKDLKLISFTYDHHPRVVEPHTFGTDHDGDWSLRAYQVRGGSKSGDFRGWKMFHLAEMHFVTKLEESFPHARRGYRRGDKAFATIQCQL